MKILNGILIVVISFIPWTFMFTFHIWLQPLTGLFWGQICVALVCLLVLLIGIYATAKGYGRQEPGRIDMDSDRKG